MFILKWVFSFFLINHCLNEKIYTSDDMNSTLLQDTELKTLFILKREGYNDTEYDCLFGGSPLVIWAYGDNDIINSSDIIKPIFIEKSFYATGGKIDKSIKTSVVNNTFLFINPHNPSNGAIRAKLFRKQDFFINTFVFPPVASDVSNKVVFNYNITYKSESNDSDYQYETITSIIPTKTFNYIAQYGIFVFANLNYNELSHYSWNQDLSWDFHLQDSNIQYFLSPSKNENKFSGKGFWICGSLTENIQDITTKKEKLYYKDYNGKIFFVDK